MTEREYLLYIYINKTRDIGKYFSSVKNGRGISEYSEVGPTHTLLNLITVNDWSNAKNIHGIYIIVDFLLLLREV
jgi:hypothetical protein